MPSQLCGAVPPSQDSFTQAPQALRLHDSAPWRKILRQNFRDWQQLAAFLQLDPEHHAVLTKAHHFPLNLPRRLAEKIQKGTLNDPVLKQFLPTKSEEIASPGFGADAVGDEASRQAPRLLHKYEGRCLLVVSSACAMHCRYCFRQHFSYAEGAANFDRELALIREDRSLSEVILSGGDPLSISNDRLKELIEALDAIPHLKRLRFHTRFPIGIPERIDEELIDLLSETRLQIWFIIHTNHVNELDEEIFTRLRRLQLLGIPVLNQAVLLKGVNDSVEALKALCETLANRGILPYYLHQLDRVEGTAHFEVDLNSGASLMSELATQLPGYAVPKYVQEIAGSPSKTLII